MTSFLKSAKFISDVELGCDIVEVEYTKYVEGENRYETFVDYYRTVPAGEWVEITSLKQNIPLEKFLDTMVEKNVEVLQKMCDVILESAQCSTRLMYTSKILDPTFTPPVVNLSRAWQRTLVDDFCMYTLPELVYHCNSERRLEKFFEVVRTIVSECDA
jgi:hypothetical protein